MKRLFVASILMIIMSVPASARPKHFYMDKKFWLSEIIIGTAVFLDYHSTATHLYGNETSPLLGFHPSSGKVAGIGLLDFGVETGLNVSFYKIARIGGPANETRTWDILGYITQPTISLATHLPAAIHNYGLQPGADSGILR